MIYNWKQCSEMQHPRRGSERWGNEPHWKHGSLVDMDRMPGLYWGRDLIVGPCSEFKDID